AALDRGAARGDEEQEPEQRAGRSGGEARALQAPLSQPAAGDQVAQDGGLVAVPGAGPGAESGSRRRYARPLAAAARETEHELADLSGESIAIAKIDPGPAFQESRRLDVVDEHWNDVAAMRQREVVLLLDPRGRERAP